MQVTQHKLLDTQYYQEEHVKSQVFIHHTAGGPSAANTILGWAKTTDRIATSYVISGVSLLDTSIKDGEILQCFSEKYFAYHLGLKSNIFTKYGLPYKALDKTSIGIELCNWGYLTKVKDTFKNYVGGIVPVDQVVKLDSPYKNYEYYHKYSDAQLLSLRELLIHLCDTYKIPKKFNDGMFEVNQACLNGSPGIWTHTSCRADKYDCFPQLTLIKMLKTLDVKSI